MKRITAFFLVLVMVLSVFTVSAFSEQTGSDVIAYGDVNGDGKINLKDASAVLKYVAKWEIELDIEAADANGDGRVSISDISLILKYIAKWDVVLGPKDKPVVDHYTFPEADFNKAEFKILHYGDRAVDFHDKYIWADEGDGGVISEAVYERNKLVEDKYNVVIAAEECDPMREAVTRMQSGQCDFEVIYEWGIRSKSAALDGLLYDFHKLDQLNLDRSYWLPDSVEGLTVADKMYIGTNMTTMNGLSWANMIFFNKNMMDELNLDYPYNYVYNNSWTYDVLLDMVTKAEKDVNRDGVMDKNDRFGGIDGYSILNGLCSAPLVEEKSDGSYELIPYTEGMVGNYSKYKTKTDAIEYLEWDEYIEGEDISDFPSQFIAARFLSFGKGHTLFMSGSFDMSKEFVNMKDDYGIVPMPLVRAGDEFTCEVDYVAPMFSIPIQVEDDEMVAIVFDYLAYESESLLFPSYIETTLKTKRMEDKRDYDMLDIIIDSVRYEWVDLYMWDSETAQLRDRMLYSGNFASVAKRYGAQCQAEIDEFIRNLSSIEY